MSHRRTGRFVALGVITALVLAACSSKGGAGSTPSSSASSSAEQISVALILPGPANDKGFNQAGYEALALLESELNAKTAYSESVPVPQYEQTFKNYINQGFDVIVAQGYEFTDVANKLAPLYPDTYFLVNNSPDIDPKPGNALGLNALQWDAGYLAGIVAAMTTTSNKIGAIGGFPFPGIVATLEAYKVGAQATNPNVQVTITYLQTFDDPEKGKEQTVAMISNGVDVVLHVADAAGLGVIQAAQEAKIKAIGFALDQNSQAPDTVITTVLLEQKFMILAGVKSILDGTFEGGVVDFGLDTPVVGLAPIRALPADEIATIQAAVDEAQAKILSGEIKVPFIGTPSE